MDRAARIARIQRIERIRAKEAELADPAQPSVAAMGDPDPSAPPAPTPGRSRTGEALLSGFGQGATMGYMPQIRAAVQPATDKLFSMLTGQEVEPESYVQARDNVIKELDMLKAENPKAFMAGELGGGLTTVAVPGGVQGSLLRRAAAGAGAGAVTAALANPGDVEGVVDPVQAGERAKNAAGGAVLGAAIPSAQKILSVAGNAMKKGAERAAFKSLGAYAKATIKNQDNVEDIGRTLIDEGVVGGLPKSYDKIAKKAGAAENVAGKGLDSYLDELDDVARRAEAGEPGLIKPGTPTTTKTGVSKKAVADAMRADLKVPETGAIGAAEHNAKVEELISGFESGADDIIGLKQAEELKRTIGDLIEKKGGWEKLPGQPVPTDLLVQKSQYSKVRQGVEDGAKFMEENFNGPSAGRFKSLKEKYGNLNEARKIAEKRDAHEFAKTFGFDSALGGLGAVGGLITGDNTEEKLENAAIGMSLGAANNIRRRIGSQVATNVLEKGRLAAKGGEVLAKKFNEFAAKNPWAAANVLRTLNEGDKNGEE